jgi:hypothetical protein
MANKNRKTIIKEKVTCAFGPKLPGPIPFFPPRSRSLTQPRVHHLPWANARYIRWSVGPALQAPNSRGPPWFYRGKWSPHRQSRWQVGHLCRSLRARPVPLPGGSRRSGQVFFSPNRSSDRGGISTNRALGALPAWVCC